MATTTTRMGLRKPAGTDLINVNTDLNANYDILDTTFKDGILNSFTAPGSDRLARFTNQNASVHPVMRLTSTATSSGRGAFQLELSHGNFPGADGMVGLDAGGAFVIAWDFGGGPARYFRFLSTGETRFSGGVHKFGYTAEGTGSGSNLVVQGLSNDTVAMFPESTFAAAHMAIRSKGAGAIYLTEQDGTELLVVQQRANYNAHEACLLMRWKDNTGTDRYNRVQIGLADSGGIGWRVLAVPN